MMDEKLNAGKIESGDVPLEIEADIEGLKQRSGECRIIMTSEKLVDIIKRNAVSNKEAITVEEYIKMYEEYTDMVPSKELCELFSAAADLTKLTEKLTEKY